MAVTLIRGWTLVLAMERRFIKKTRGSLLVIREVWKELTNLTTRVCITWVTKMRLWLPWEIVIRIRKRLLWTLCHNNSEHWITWIIAIIIHVITAVIFFIFFEIITASRIVTTSVWIPTYRRMRDNLPICSWKITTAICLFSLYFFR